MENHPIADLFPMFTDDELSELAEDIKQRGLLQPIVLDTDGRVLDGRNRLAACRLANLEPEFTTYDGDDPDGFALSVNIARRNLTKGQQAMVVAKARSEAKKHTDSEAERHVRSEAKRNGLSAARISQASTVLQHAPDLADAVISGAMGLDEAYKVARENKAAADSAESQLARLRAEDPELADKVVDGVLTLGGAWAEHRERAATFAAARQESLNAWSQANDGLTTALSYAKTYAPPDDTDIYRSVDDFIQRAEELLGIARNWKDNA